MLTLAPIFTDHMVLQRGRPIPIWGTAKAGDEIKVSLGGHSATTVASEDGRWRVDLGPLQASLGLKLMVEVARARIVVIDVAIGEVWIAAGQSNIEFELRQAIGGNQAATQSANLRLYRPAFGWRAAATDGIEYMSAVGWWAGQRLSNELGCPVGIVGAYLGGTSITAWMNRDWLAQFPAGRAALSQSEYALYSRTAALHHALKVDFERRSADYDATWQQLADQHPDWSHAQIKAAGGIAPWPPPITVDQLHRPMRPYEEFVAPLVPFAVRGFIYYQGEEDTAKPDGYSEALLYLMKFWRREFELPQAPFVIVQLPGYADTLDGLGGVSHEGWAEIRDAQQRACDLDDNSALVVTIDLGEKDEIHPANKATVGRRVADASLRLAYGRQTPTSARFEQGYRHNNGALIWWDQPLQAGQWDESGVELADLQGRWFPARVQVEDRQVWAYSAYVPHPFGARYAWDGFPVAAVLRGENGLPAAPFNTGVGGLNDGPSPIASSRRPPSEYSDNYPR